MTDPFATLGLSPARLSVLAALAFTEPTAIQRACIPPLLAGRDLVGRSRTGSGKTAAFVLPLLDRIAFDAPGPQALILCPTRELCAQVARDVRTLGRGQPGLGVLEVTGGQRIEPQIDALARGVHVVVGTPGRVIDHLGRATLDLSRVAVAVLDEADRMLDMGFGKDVDSILDALPPGQTALFTATLPDDLAAIAQRHLTDPVHVSLDDDAAPAIAQHRVTVSPDADFDGLCRALAAVPHDAALVFCNLKTTVRDVVARLQRAGVSATRLDGDLDQHQRDQSMAMLRNGSVRVLVATDVAGRGLDVDGLDLVVNLELPPDPAAYIHRIGRTGRAGRAGIAVSIAAQGRDRRLSDIEAATGVPVTELALGAHGTLPLDIVLAGLAGPSPRATLRLSAGRKDGLRPGDILGALTGDVGLDGSDVGRIEVLDHLTWVAVSREVADRAVRTLDRIKKRRVRVARVAPIAADA